MKIIKIKFENEIFYIPFEVFQMININGVQIIDNFSKKVAFENETINLLKNRAESLQGLSKKKQSEYIQKYGIKCITLSPATMLNENELKQVQKENKIWANKGQGDKGQGIFNILDRQNAWNDAKNNNYL